MKINVRNSDDKKIGWAIAFLLFSSPIITCVNDITNFIYPNIVIDTIACYSIIGIVVLIALPAIFKRMNIYDYIFLFSIVLIFSFNFLVFPINRIQLSAIASRFSPFVLPYYFLGRTIRDVKITTICIRPIALASITCSVLTNIILYSAGSAKIYDMTYAYTLLPIVLFYIFELFQKINIKNIILSIIAVALLILAGTRGSLVCVLAFIFFSAILHLKKTRDYIILILASATGAYILISNTYMNILVAVNNFMLSIGIKNRILSTIINGVFMESKERELLADKIIYFINSGGFFGQGIGADRIVLGGYPHNLIYEIWCHFGYLIGSIILIFVISLLFRGFKKSNVLIDRYFFGMLICASIVKLFMSGSYLNEALLWLLFGYCMRVNEIKKPQTIFGGKNV